MVRQVERGNGFGGFAKRAPEICVHHWAGGSVHDRPPTPLYKYFSTHPRILHYILLLCYQPVAQGCAFTVAQDGSSPMAKAFAAVIFLCWPVGLLVYMYWVISVKVLKEKRAMLIKNDARTGGILAWMDMPPAWQHSAERYTSRMDRFYYSGFCP